METISIRAVLPIAFCLLLAMATLCASDENKFGKALDLVEDMDYSGAIEVLEQVFQKNETPGTRGQQYYVMATCYRQLERWAKAISYYQLALGEDEFMFADLAHLHIATGHGNLYNYGAAIKWYETILTDHSGSSAAKEAQYQLGESYYKMEEYEAAIQHCEKFIEDYPKEERVRAAAYKMGSAYQEVGQWSDAYVLYQGMLRQNTRDEMAGMAVNKIRSLVSSYPIPITRDDGMYYGQTLYYAKQYKAAREELQKVIDKPDELSAKAAYFMAESYHRERKYDKAIQQYAAVVEDYPQSEYAETAEYQIALCHRKAGRKKKFRILLADFAATRPTSDLADNAQFEIAEHYKGEEQYKAAADAYGKVVARHTGSDLVDDSLWNIGWCHIKLKDKAGGKSAFQRLLNEHPDSPLAGSARFWIGVIYERMEEWQEAADIYKEVMGNNAWYYSDRAKRRLEQLDKRGEISADEALIQYKKLRIDESVPAWQNISMPLPGRIQNLLALRVFDDAIGELLTAAKTGEALESIYYSLAVHYEKMGDFNNSWRYARRLSRLPGMESVDGAMPRQLHRMSYPIAFREAVFSNSEKNNLDPLLILAIMQAESAYEPSAVSWAGAIGLIQIMPPTARDIAQRLKVKPFRAEMLLQPEINIRFGTWYLASLMKSLDKHVGGILSAEKTSEIERSYIIKMLAAGAYNGGQTRVRRWIKRYGIKDMDEFVESIPIPETKRYIKKVFSSYEIYSSLYNEERASE